MNNGDRQPATKETTVHNSYGELISGMVRWAAGQRLVHDLVVHPLMALTGYSDWALKLHDYHGFAHSEAGKRTLGIMGREDDVMAAFEALGIDVENTHRDGVVCCGTGEPPPAPGPGAKCPKCDGGGQIVGREYRDQRWGVYSITCPTCGGSGSVPR